MKFLLIGAFILAYLFSVCFRVAVTHPVSTAKYSVRDLYGYIKFCKWNELKTGKIIAYIGLFGKGKTLSGVHYIVSLYFRYNDKKIFDFSRNKWVMQKVQILSNVDLAIPYTKLEGLEQIVTVSEMQKEIDEANDTLTITLVFIDEASVQLNSREFKTNIDPLFLNTILTCRHHHISLIYTAQRFQHVDALLRQVTSYAVSCNKVWL